MKCPKCKEGTIYVYMPIVYKCPVGENGSFNYKNSRKVISDRWEPVSDEAQCNCCGKIFEIEDGRVTKRQVSYGVL
jgi:hypothetical protein